MCFLRFRIPVKHLFLPVFFLLTGLAASAQTAMIDSLQSRLKTKLPDTTRLSTLRKLSAAYTSVDPLKKLRAAQEYHALAIRLKNSEAVADALSDMGVSCSIRGNNDSALYYFRSAYKQAEAANYPIGMGKSLVNTGYTYDRLDNNSESIKYYFQALEIFKKVGMQKGINQCNTNIGSIYYDLGQFKLALSYFQPVLDNYEKSQDQKGLAHAQFTVGNCRSELGEYEKALTYFNRSLAIREKIEDISGQALVHRSLGILYRNTGKYPEALEHLEIALPIVENLQDKYLQGSVLNVIAKTYLEMNRYRLSEEYALRGLEMGKQAESKMVSSEALWTLALANKKMNRLEKAFKYQEAYTSMKDSILNETILKDVTMIELARARSENTELSKDNREIQSQNNDNAGKLEKYGRAIFITIALLVLVLGAALVLYKRNNDKQAVNKLLLQQKEKIAAINAELESLNEEITTQNEITNAQNLELERLNAIKNKFFSIISHDLRSPLNTLRSLLAFSRQGTMDARELGEFLAELEGTIIDTAAFLDNLLEWSKSQMDGIAVKAIDFDLRRNISDNIRLHEAQANLKHVSISNVITVPLQVHADYNMINLVIRNLLSNSIKFCDEGDTIRFDARADENHVVVSISDTGRGINEKDSEKLFSLEHTLSTGTQGEKGNGLGLILCRDMLQLNNGRIWFETAPGEGTTFYFELPAS